MFVSAEAGDTILFKCPDTEANEAVWVPAEVKVRFGDGNLEIKGHFHLPLVEGTAVAQSWRAVG